MGRLLEAISTTSFVAGIILFIWYMIHQADPYAPMPPSGWWWLSCILLGVFTDNLKKD